MVQLRLADCGQFFFRVCLQVALARQVGNAVLLLAQGGTRSSLDLILLRGVGRSACRRSTEECWVVFWRLHAPGCFSLARGISGSLVRF